MASEVLAPNAPKRPKSRHVVFLDQNVICELAKHRLGRPSSFSAGAKRLLDSLDAAVVKRQVAVCVESIYHRIESEPLDGGPDNGALFEEAWGLLGGFTRNLSFEDRRQILGYEVFAAISAARGVPWPEDARNNRTFDEDPDKRWKGDFFLRVPWRTRFGPLLKWAHKAEAFRNERSRPPEEIFEILVDGSRGQIEEERLHVSWSDEHHPDPKYRITPNDILTVVRSPAFSTLPYVTVQASLLAAVLSEPKRPFEDSDIVDTHYYAAALPRCDFLMVDSYMAERIKQLKLAELYGAQVFASKQTDCIALAERLDALTEHGNGPGPRSSRLAEGA